MKRAIFIITVAMFGVLTAFPVFAQGGQFSVAFSMGFPQGEFNNNVRSKGFGGNINAGIQLGKVPFYGGLEVGFLNYGSETRNVPFSLTIPDVFVDVTTSNNIVQANLLLRAQSPIGKIRPYADALVGVNYLYTDTKIEDESNTTGEIASSVNQDDTAFNYGAGGGIMILLTETNRDDDKQTKGRSYAIMLDIRLRYLLGAKATYLRKGGVTRDSGQVTLDPITSKTDLLTVNVGVSFLL